VASCPCFGARTSAFSGAFAQRARGCPARAAAPAAEFLETVVVADSTPFAAEKASDGSGGQVPPPPGSAVNGRQRVSPLCRMALFTAPVLQRRRLAWPRGFNRDLLMTFPVRAWRNP
jgi:hypothetical protein